MNESWQNVISLAIVALAVVYLFARLARWWLPTARSASSCGGGCAGCHGNSTSELPAESIVPLDSLAPNQPKAR